MHRDYLAAIPNSSKVIYFPGLERGKNEFLRKVKPVIKTLISSTRRVSTLSQSHVGLFRVITSPPSTVRVYIGDLERNRNFSCPSLVEAKIRKQPKETIQTCSEKAVREWLHIMLSKDLNLSVEKSCLTFQSFLEWLNGFSSKAQFFIFKKVEQLVTIPLSMQKNIAMSYIGGL